MVASAVLGAAAGTGMALIVAMTIVIYRYYTLKRRDKEWGSLDRVAFPDKKSTKPIYAAVTQKSVNNMILTCKLVTVKELSLKIEIEEASVIRILKELGLRRLVPGVFKKC
ncbi:hypothetical protein FQA39_LY12133 [Lamprigera yunnana]|nr:hypothetical protein FQA39_LY12133 [Lamprigera yunnana]